MDLTFEDCEPSALNLQRGLWGKISSISEDTLEALRQRRVRHEICFPPNFFSPSDWHTYAHVDFYISLPID
mgnify:CR=1 FL=1